MSSEIWNFIKKIYKRSYIKQIGNNNVFWHPLGQNTPWREPVTTEIQK